MSNVTTSNSLVIIFAKLNLSLLSFFFVFLFFLFCCSFAMSCKLVGQNSKFLPFCDRLHQIFYNLSNLFKAVFAKNGSELIHAKTQRTFSFNLIARTPTHADSTKPIRGPFLLLWRGRKDGRRAAATQTSRGEVTRCPDCSDRKAAPRAGEAVPRAAAPGGEGRSRRWASVEAAD
jgi:hypothetical protein